MQVDLELDLGNSMQKVEELKAALVMLSKQDPGSPAVEKITQALGQAQTKVKQLESQVKAFEERGRAGRNALLQVLGGEDLPEKVGKIKAALAAAGDSAQDFGTRAAGLAGGAGLAFGVVGRAVGAVAEALYHVNVRTAEHAEALGALGPAYESVREATHGLVSAEQALVDRQALLREGLHVSGAQFGQLEGAMHNWAAATGGNASAAMLTFARAVHDGNQAALIPFGVTLSQTKDQATQLADALRQMQATIPQAPARLADRAAAFGWRALDTAQNIATLGMSSQVQREQAAAAGVVAQAMANLESAQDRARDATAARAVEDKRAADASEHAAQMIEVQNKALRDSSEETERFNALMREGTGPGLKNLMADSSDLWVHLDRQDQAARQAAEATRDLAKANSLLGFSIQRLPGETMEEATARLFAMGVAASQVNRETRTLSERLNHMFDAAHIDRRDRPGGLSGGGGGGPNLGRQAAEEALGAVRQLQAANLAASAFVEAYGHRLVAMAEVERARGESAVHYWHRIHDAAVEAAEGAQLYLSSLQGQEEAQKRLNEELADNNRLKGAAARAMDEAANDNARALAASEEARKAEEHHAGIAAAAESAQGAENAAQQFSRTFGGLAEQNVSAAQAMATGAGSAFQALTGAVQSHFQALVEGRETGAQALQGIVHDTLAALAQMAIVQALVETAAGIASLAVENYKGAIQHFASAGVYAGVAVLAGIGAAAIPSPSAAAGGGAGAGAGKLPREASAVPASNNSEGRTINNTYYISGLFGEKAENQLVNMQNRAAARGHIPHTVRRLDRPRV